MPDNKLEKETDGNPQRYYEDTAGHERVGFVIDESAQLSEVDKPQSPEDRIPEQ